MTKIERLHKQKKKIITVGLDSMHFNSTFLEVLTKFPIEISLFQEEKNSNKSQRYFHLVLAKRTQLMK